MSSVSTSQPSRRPISRLILVFDANSGALGAFVDSVKKVFMIKGCPLCSITHGLAGERAEWAMCKDDLGIPVDYLHRDELTPAVRAVVGEDLPCIVADAQGDLVVLLRRDVLERCTGGVADLRGRLHHYAAIAGLFLPDRKSTP